MPELALAIQAQANRIGWREPELFRRGIASSSDVMAVIVVRECCTSGMNEWQLQEVLRSRWLTDGVVINDEPHLLAGWEVMTNWERNDAHGRFNLPSADFVLLNRRGRLVVLELKMRIRSPGECLRALCQVTHMAVQLAETFTLDKLAKLSVECRGDASTSSKSDPVELLREAHQKFFSLSAPAPLVATEVRRTVAACEFGLQWASTLEFFTDSSDDLLRAHLQSHYGVTARSNLAMRRYLELPSPLARCSPEVATLLVRAE